MVHTQPTNSFREGNTASYYQGSPTVDKTNFESQRLYDRHRGLLSYIKQGRANFTRLLLASAKSMGAYVATDVETRWGIEYERLPRIYMTANSASTANNKHDILKVSESDGVRIQPGDVFALMGFYTKANRNVGDMTSDIPTTTRSSSAPLPEMVRVKKTVQTNDGYSIYVDRCFGCTGLAAAGAAGMEVDYDNSTFQPFLWRAADSLIEDSDDQQIYSDTNDWDYNFCQYVMRKWGAGEAEESVKKMLTRPGETTMARNGRKMLNEFFDSLDVTALLGNRKKEVSSEGKRWYAGGLMEFIPADNYIGIDETFFQTKNWNSYFKNKFYYGAQAKILLAGENFYTRAANMIDNRFLSLIPANTNSWGVELIQFRVANGGIIYLTNSDTMSLNGMADYGILYDPETFKYGHLQGLDIKTIDVPQTNPHKREKEVYGYITFQRTNPDANYVFLPSSGYFS